MFHSVYSAELYAAFMRNYRMTIIVIIIIIIITATIDISDWTRLTHYDSSSVNSRYHCQHSRRTVRSADTNRRRIRAVLLSYP